VKGWVKVKPFSDAPDALAGVARPVAEVGRAHHVRGAEVADQPTNPGFGVGQPGLQAVDPHQEIRPARGCHRRLEKRRCALPRLGGVAIFLSFSLSLAAAALLASYVPGLHSALSSRTLLTILVPASLVFLLGVYDDLYTAGPYVKFAVQAVAATMLFMGGLRILNIPVLFGSHQLPWFVGLPFTVLWVLAITNAFNLIDGLDGLAAGSALFSTLVAFVVALLNGYSLVTVMTIALAGAILGFLRYNFNPATIFLGDSGSLFIGFLLSALALAGAQKAPTIVAVAIPVVSFGLPILETSLSILRRLISGRPVFTADREHIHHKLLQHGLTHRQVVIVLYAVSAVFALLSLFLLWPTGSSLGLVLAVLGIGIWIGVQRLGYLELGELGRVAQRTLEQRQRSEEVRLNAFSGAHVLKRGLFEEATNTFERNFILRALEKCGWNVTGTAEYLGVPLSTLQYKMDKLDVRQIAKRLRGA